jgi:hypothetical protein
LKHAVGQKSNYKTFGVQGKAFSLGELLNKTKFLGGGFISRK